MTARVDPATPASPTLGRLEHAHARNRARCAHQRREPPIPAVRTRIASAPRAASRDAGARTSCRAPIRSSATPSPGSLGTAQVADREAGNPGCGMIVAPTGNTPMLKRCWFSGDFDRLSPDRWCVSRIRRKSAPSLPDAVRAARRARRPRTGAWSSGVAPMPPVDVARRDRAGEVAVMRAGSSPTYSAQSSEAARAEQLDDLRQMLVPPAARKDFVADDDDADARACPMSIAVVRELLAGPPARAQAVMPEPQREKTRMKAYYQIMAAATNGNSTIIQTDDTHTKVGTVPSSRSRRRCRSARCCTSAGARRGSRAAQARRRSSRGR